MGIGDIKLEVGHLLADVTFERKLSSVDLSAFNETAVAMARFCELYKDGTETGRSLIITKDEWIGDKALYACSNALVQFFAELTSRQVPTPGVIQRLMDKYGITFVDQVEGEGESE